MKTCAHKDLHTYIHNSFLLIDQSGDNLKPQLVNGYTNWYPDNEVLFSNE